MFLQNLSIRPSESLAILYPNVLGNPPSNLAVGVYSNLLPLFCRNDHHVGSTSSCCHANGDQDR